MRQKPVRRIAILQLPAECAANLPIDDGAVKAVTPSAASQRCVCACRVLILAAPRPRQEAGQAGRLVVAVMALAPFAVSALRLAAPARSTCHRGARPGMLLRMAIAAAVSTPLRCGSPLRGAASAALAVKPAGSAATGTLRRVSFSMSLRNARSSPLQKEMAMPAGAGARGAADAVDVALRHVRQVVVHDVADALDVDAARGDVGGDEHARRAAP